MQANLQPLVPRTPKMAEDAPKMAEDEGPPILPALPHECLLSIFERLKPPESGDGLELKELVAVGGVYSPWRRASLATRFSASVPLKQLRRFSELVGVLL